MAAEEGSQRLERVPGDRLAVIDREVVGRFDEVRLAGTRGAIAIQADVTGRDSILAAAQRVEEELGASTSWSTTPA
jgi:hypothetical protein